MKNNMKWDLKLQMLCNTNLASMIFQLEKNSEKYLTIKNVTVDDLYYIKNAICLYSVIGVRMDQLTVAVNNLAEKNKKRSRGD